MKAIIFVFAIAALTPNAHASATDAVNVVSCGVGGVAGMAVSAKTMDALNVKSSGLAFAGLMTGAVAGCAGTMYLAQPLAEHLDAFPGEPDLNDRSDENQE